MNKVIRKSIITLIVVLLSSQPVIADPDETLKVVGIGVVAMAAFTAMMLKDGIYLQESGSNYYHLYRLLSLSTTNLYSIRRSNPSFSYSPLYIDPKSQNVFMSFEVRF